MSTETENGAKVNSTFDIVTFEAKLKSEQKSISDRVRELGSNMQSVYKLSAKMDSYYNYRQDLMDMKRTYMSMSNKYNKRLFDDQEKVLTSFRLGSKRDANNVAIVPKNDFEREIYMKKELSGLKYLIMLIDDHLDHIASSIKNIDGMTYGFEYTIKLHEFTKSA